MCIVGTGNGDNIQCSGEQYISVPDIVQFMTSDPCKGMKDKTKYIMVQMRHAGMFEFYNCVILHISFSKCKSKCHNERQ